MPTIWQSRTRSWRQFPEDFPPDRLVLPIDTATVAQWDIATAATSAAARLDRVGEAASLDDVRDSYYYVGDTVGPGQARALYTAYKAVLKASLPSARIAGDVTVEAIVVLMRPHEVSAWAASSVAQPILACAGADSTASANNQQWGVGLGVGGAGLTWRSESGSGTISTATCDLGIAPRVPTYLAATRSGTTISWYLQGELVGTATVATAPTGGESTELWIGNAPKAAGTNTPHLGWFCVSVSSGARDADSVTSRYIETLGDYYR